MNGSYYNLQSSLSSSRISSQSSQVRNNITNQIKASYRKTLQKAYSNESSIYIEQAINGKPMNLAKSTSKPIVDRYINDLRRKLQNDINGTNNLIENLKGFGIQQDKSKTKKVSKNNKVCMWVPSSYSFNDNKYNVYSGRRIVHGGVFSRPYLREVDYYNNKLSSCVFKTDSYTIQSAKDAVFKAKYGFGCSLYSPSSLYNFNSSYNSKIRDLEQKISGAEFDLLFNKSSNNHFGVNSANNFNQINNSFSGGATWNINYAHRAHNYSVEKNKNHNNLILFRNKGHIVDIHRTIKPKKSDIIFYSPDDVLKMKGENVIYVILPPVGNKKDNTLLVAARKYSKDEYIFHSDLAGGRNVIAAGEITVKYGKIANHHINDLKIKLDDCSGHYLPSGKHLEKLVIDTFIKNGYKLESKYKYRCGL